MVRLIAPGIAAFSILCVPELRAHDEDEVLAIVAGHKITRAELDQKEAGSLLQARHQYYLAERDALNKLIDRYLLEERARAEHLGADELIQRDVTSRIRKDPTEDQLEVYYEGLGTDEPFPAVRNNILEHIRQVRQTRARAEYVKALRNRQPALISLAPPGVDVSPGDAPVRGPRDAPVVLIEFADYECPYCQQVHAELKKLDKEFSGLIALAFKDFPLPMHPRAQRASEAARCAGTQGRFWEFHDMLLDASGRIDVPQLKEYARSLRLNGERFDHCLDSGQEAAAVKKDFTEAQRLGLNGTPSFFVNGHFISGAVKYGDLRELVRQQLKLKAPQPVDSAAAEGAGKTSR